MSVPARRLPRQLRHDQHKAIVTGFLEGKDISDLAVVHALRRQTVESAIRDAMIHVLRMVPDVSEPAPAEAVAP